ncbi:cyclin-J18 isoform X1 [Lotus japonicus]|uniref:cyclin-J18 isoform X1 n=1 Tax=Lotus japonicus TaxID=34305 RepID=UPI00258DCC51|nr:cyclin-J18 isoform X1 [Lotus japonicus]
MVLVTTSSSSSERVPAIEFLIQSAQLLQVPPIVKYSALSLFADRFLPSLPADSPNWLLQPLTESALQLFVLMSLWISSKVSLQFQSFRSRLAHCDSLHIHLQMHDTQPLSATCLKSLADKSIKEQHYTTRNFIEAEMLFMQVLNFEIGTTNITFVYLEELWIQFKGVTKVGELIDFDVCMDVMDLLYEKEETSFLYRSPHSLAASILVVSYIITVPKQKWEFPVLAWVNFVTSYKEEDIMKRVMEILKHVLEPS